MTKGNRTVTGLLAAIPYWYKVLLCGAALAVVTGWIGWYGISDWDGETGGNALILLGLPWIVSVMNLPEPLSWVIGGLAQHGVCLDPVLIVSGIITARKRAGRPVCECGYSLVGLTGDKCPECGKKTP